MLTPYFLRVSRITFFQRALCTQISCLWFPSTLATMLPGNWSRSFLMSRRIPVSREELSDAYLRTRVSNSATDHQNQRTSIFEGLFGTSAIAWFLCFELSGKQLMEAFCCSPAIGIFNLYVTDAPQRSTVGVSDDKSTNLIIRTVGLANALRV